MVPVVKGKDIPVPELLADEFGRMQPVACKHLEVDLRVLDSRVTTYDVRSLVSRYGTGCGQSRLWTT